MKKDDLLIDTLESDENGRLIIKDPEILDLINGSLSADHEAWRQNIACGNENCWCG